jgi:thiamine-phosphate pyrophosphorylase
MNSIDYSLMFVTDDSVTDNDAFFKILEDSLKGGATIIQLREKNCDTYTFYKRALQSKTLCHSYKVPLIINDRIDVALAVDADGVHIGQKDLPYSLTRKLVGINKIIGLSVSDRAQAIEAEKLGADYIGISPIFKTSTKKSDLAAPLGIEGLQIIRTLFSKPIVCIGGIQTDNVANIIKNGSNGIAVISAISKAAFPEKETKKLKEIIWQTGIRQ